MFLILLVDMLQYLKKPIPQENIKRTINNNKDVWAAGLMAMNAYECMKARV